MMVFAYGAKAPTRNAEVVDQQIKRAHRYYNVLIGVERERREAVTLVYDELAPKLAVDYRKAAVAVRGLAPPHEGNEKLAKLLDGEADRIVEIQAAKVRAKERRLAEEASRVSGRGTDLAVAKPSRADGETTSKATKWYTAKAASDAAWEIAWRAWATWREALDPRVDPINQRCWAQAKAEYGRTGIYWGTRLVIGDAVDRAMAATPPNAWLRHREWTEQGVIAVQIQKAMTTEELLSGEDSRARIIKVKADAGSRGGRLVHELWIRVGGEGRTPEWAVFPIVYHRDLPPGALVKWVRVHRRKVATHHVWSAQIVFDEPPGMTPARKVSAVGEVAIDVGWRRFPAQGMRVAAWIDSACKTGELRVPERLFVRMRKVEDLKSIRDKNFNAAREALCVARRAAVRAAESGAASAWPAALLRETQHAHAWLAPEKLGALVWRWRTRRFPGDEGLYATLEAWRKQERHLYEWEANQRENVLLARREVYRLFGLQMAGYRTIVIERLDLRDFAELPAKDEKEAPALAAARGNRHFAALSELLGCIAQAAKKWGSELKEVNPAKTTMVHHSCGFEGPVEPRERLLHTCSQCGEEFDQDINAARNILERGLASGVRSKRVRVEVRDSQGNTPAEARRLRGLATRRTKAQLRNELEATKAE